MNPTTIYLYLIFFLIFMLLNRKRNEDTAINFMKNKKNREELTVMKELAKRFIDEECVISTFNGRQIVGTIKEISENAMTIENKNGDEQVVNLEFVFTIQKYPRNKNGKKKMIV